jgi:hypothetical protein
MSGFTNTFKKVSAPAKRMEVPTDVDTITDANADRAETIKLFQQYGTWFLAPEEVRTLMPEYPLDPRFRG